MLVTIEPEFTGRAVAIVAGGPSLTLADVRLLGMARARNLIRVIAVNDAVYPCWFADIAYACDRRWWHHHAGLPGFSGRRLGLDDPGVDGVDFLHNTGPTGFDPDPWCLRSGGNSGYQALHLSAHLGAKRVLLLGFDMRGVHWFGQHPPELRRAVPPKHDIRIRRFDDLIGPLKERGIAVVNVTPDSALGAFPRSTLSAELSRVEAMMAKPQKPVTRPPRTIVPANRAMTSYVKR